MGLVPAAHRGYLKRLDSQLSIHYPFIWRTRMPLWLGLGSAGCGIAAASALTQTLRTDAMPSLDAIVFWLWMGTFVFYGVLLLMLIEVVRGTPSIVAGTQALRLFACVTVSVVALLLPQEVFITLTIPRIARLETEARAQSLLDFHGRYEFWHCMSSHDLKSAIHEHSETIQADLRRYGLETDFSLRPQSWSQQCPADEQRGFDPLSLRAWNIGHRDRMDVTAIHVFEQRLQNIAAAQRYVHDLESPYTVFSIANTWPIAIASGVVAGVAATTTLFWIRVVAGGRRVIGALKRRRRYRSSLGGIVASRWPSVWSSRVPAVAFYFVVGPIATVTIAASEMMDSTVLLWVCVPAGVLTLFAALRSQERFRYHSMSTRTDLVVFLMHGVVFLSLAVAAVWLAPYVLSNGRTRQVDNGGVAATVLFVVAICGALQAGRNSSAMASCAGCILALSLFYMAFAAATSIERTLSAPGDLVRRLAMMGIASTSCACVIGACLWYSIRTEARAGVRTVLISAFLVTAPVVGMYWSINLMSSPSRPTRSDLAILTACGTLAMGLALRLTESTRRVLASTSR